MKNRIYLHSVDQISLLISTASYKYALRDKCLIFDSLLAGINFDNKNDSLKF